MALPAEIITQVRQRVNYACQYCGISEADSAAAWTVVANVLLNLDGVLTKG